MGPLWILRVFFVYGALLTYLASAFIQYLVSDLEVSKLVKIFAILDVSDFIDMG